MRTVALGDLSSVDLGTQVTGPAPAVTRGVPKATGPIKGKLESVHHFIVDGQQFTSCIVRVILTRAEREKKVPDCREVRGPSSTEIEVGA